MQFQTPIRLSLAILLATVVFCSAFISFQPKPIILKLNLPANTKYVYQSRILQDLDMQGMTMKTKINGDYDMVVLKSDKGQHEVEFRYRYFLMDINMNGQALIQADTKSTDTTIAENSKMINKIFKGMIGVPLTAKINEYGSISSITGSDMLKSKMLNQPGITEEMKSRMEASIDETFSEKTMISSFEQAFKIFPEKPINIGDSWKLKTNGSSNGMTVVYDNTYTLEKISGNIAILLIKGSLKTEGESKNPQIKGMSGTQEGKINVDIKTGLAIEGNINQNLNMESAAATQPIPIKQVVSYTVRKQ
jgi:hypothetical protein